MIHMTLSQASIILGIHGSALPGQFSGISIDSRTLQPSNLFIAITGEHFDGHQFIPEAIQKGAAAAVVDKPVDTPLFQLKVQDTAKALGQLSAAWRDQFLIPFIAVTGSNGKTTLKNMITAILIAACEDAKYVLASKGNFNNAYGVPLTLACLNQDHRYAVIEMGMNHFGEIAYLTKLTRPQVAVITNAAPCHLEGIGDLNGVAKAKAEIFLGLPNNGIAILNRDDQFFDYWHQEIGERTCLTFGDHPKSDVRATLHKGDQALAIEMHTPAGEIGVELPLLGNHNVKNALAATAATLALNIPLHTIKKGLESILPEHGRLEMHRLSTGVNIIDDTYNANPNSLYAAVETLANFKGRKILVLGDMKELGNEERALHEQAGLNIRAAGIDMLFTYGDLTQDTASSFGEGAYHFKEQAQLVHALKPLLKDEATVLIKGSRSMKMENVVAELIGST